jgi:hypothetical protein
MVVGDGARDVRDATRYVEALPKSAQVFLCAPTEIATKLVETAKEREVFVQRCPTPGDTVRVAHVAVVFGRCPFDERDIEILAEQGIPVEYDMRQRKRGGGAPGVRRKA